MAKIAILGYGTVGSGVAEVIRTNNRSINSKAGEDVEIKYILDLRDFPGDPMESAIVHDFGIIANDPEIDVVVETMGGKGAAYEFTKRALSAGKSVCTSNKELVAEHGEELMELAGENNANYLFEASCGGTIPIIRPLNNAMTADEIEELVGIMNGTTNYILTKMTFEGADYAEVLSQAQALGYAEKDPTADVEGHDTCRKLAILSAIAFGMHVSYKDVKTEGITGIDSTDIEYADALGMKIKLVGMSKRIEGGITCMVCPMLISDRSPMYLVDDVFNAILVKGNMSGEVMFYGKGAGKLPTGSAVVADVVDLIKNKGRNIMAGQRDDELKVFPSGKMESRFFVRVEGDVESLDETISSAFGDVECVCLDGRDEFAFVTAAMTEDEFESAVSGIGNVVKMIRVRIEE
ncbi:MAG: homoserine dehydrogenase [Lachnospiraceae bacterium]|jgi:homoserine dehydrogenase